MATLPTAALNLPRFGAFRCLVLWTTAFKIHVQSPSEMVTPKCSGLQVSSSPLLCLFVYLLVCLSVMLQQLFLPKVLQSETCIRLIPFRNYHLLVLTPCTEMLDTVPVRQLPQHSGRHYVFICWHLPLVTKVTILRRMNTTPYWERLGVQEPILR